MSSSLTESPDITSGSVIHIPNKSTHIYNDPDFTAESSSFISNPDNSEEAVENASEQKPIFLSEDASTSDLDDKVVKEKSFENSISQSLAKIGDSFNKEDSIGLGELNGISELNITSNSSGTKILDETNSEQNHTNHDNTQGSSHLSGSDTDHFSSEGSPTPAQSMLRKSPFESPTRKPELAVQICPPYASSRSESESEFQNSSFLDDTRAQFDLDINIDEYQLNTKQRQSSPWRNFRSSSPKHNPIRDASVFSRRNFSEASTAGAASTEKIEDLSKQLTNCKIQLKLYEKFLQDLIDTQSINLDEVSTFHSNFDKNTDANKGSHTANPSSFREVSPDKESLEMASLLEDLYASLEEYESKWRDADGKVSVLSSAISSFAKEVSSILEKIGLDTLEFGDDNINDQPQLYLDKIIRSLCNIPLTNSSQSPTKSIAESPRMAVGEKEFQGVSPTRTQRNYNSDFGSMTSTPKRSELGAGATANESINNKLQEYQAMIDRLQKEVNDLKDQSRVGSVSDLSENTFYSHGTRDREKYLLLQKDYENLQGMHHDLIDEHHRYKNSSERTIASLKTQVDGLQKDKSLLRSELGAMNSVQRDLEVSIEKQRILTTEKIKLSYQVEALNSEKHALQSNIERLTERLATASEKTAPSLEALRRKASDASDLVERLLDVDVEQFERLLKSFNKIADDKSLEIPRQRITFMVPLKGSRVLDQQSKVISSLEDAHKYVSRFFSRAVEVIVNDHIRLLLKDSEQKEEHDVLVEDLRRQIKTYEERSRQVKERKEAVPSPRSKLRIEELTNRWKAEREARILENRQAKKRLQELGQEKKMSS